MRSALVVLALLLPTFAGCVTPGPGAVTQTGAGPIDDVLHELGIIVDAAIPVEGGVELAGTVYLPDVPEGTKVPVLMDMGPYYGQILGAETSQYDADNPPDMLYAYFLERGYAIALVSVRGTGSSGGCFMVGGAQERADVAAAVEWLAAQEWSSGAVAMTGVSYDGTTPWEGLVSGAAPSLKAIVPVEGISDFYRYSFYEGVPVGGGASFNTYYEALVDVTYTSPTTLADWAPTMASHLCPEQAEVYATPYQTYRDGVHGPYWDDRDMSAMLADSTAAVFVVHGAKDFNVKMDHVQTIWDMLPGPRRMLIGQWEHNIPWSNSYDHEQNWTRYNETILQFLDAHVKGDADALAREQAAAPVLVQDSANRTWELTAWPPAESTPRAWNLGADGALTMGAAKEGAVTMRAKTVSPLLGGFAEPLAAEEIAFVSEPLASDTIFMGNPWIELNVSVDQPRGSLEARLYVEHADGERELVSQGWQNLATRTSRDQAEDVPTGETMAIRILLLGLAQNVPKGEKLVLILTPDPTDTLTQPAQATAFTVTLGGESGARAWLPVFAPNP